MIPAIVLTAGLGTRLRPLSLVRAKAACPVAGEPLVRRILRQLSHGGVTDAVLNLHHLPHTITHVVGDGSDLGLRVRYSWESTVLGSAGGPRRALPLLERTNGDIDTFFIVNGDTLTDVDLTAMLHAHRRSGALVTMAVVPNTQPEKYGGLAATRAGVFTGFVPAGAPQPSWHFIGVQVASAAAFAPLPDDIPTEVHARYPAVAAERADAIRIFQCEAEFIDIGTPADYLHACQRIAALTPGSTHRGARTVVDATAHVIDSVLWDDVVVEAGATLDTCIVTDGVRVPAGTSWQHAILRVPEGSPMAGERVVEGVAVSELPAVGPDVL